MSAPLPVDQQHRHVGLDDAIGLHLNGANDPLAVMQEIIATDQVQAMAIAGYSLGGNLALKLTGELGARAAESSMYV